MSFISSNCTLGCQSDQITKSPRFYENDFNTIDEED